jgi:choline monooxygenase
MFANGVNHSPNGQPTRGDYLREETYRATRLPVDHASTLIPEAYRCPQFYAAEQERVWSRGWVCVGYTSQIREAGDTFITNVAGQPLIVTRDRSGRPRAFYNVCRHRASQLVLQDCKQEIIRCPYHSWGYALDGRLLGAPYFKGLDIPAEEQAHASCQAKDFCKEDYGLLPVAVDTWGCLVCVNLDPHATPLREWLGDLPERYPRHPLDELVLVRRQSFTIQANWKLVAENFMEYYHLPWVHPELCNISGFKDHYRYQGPGMYTGMRTTPLSVDPNTVRFDLPVMPGLHPLEATSAFWILLFPNIAVFLLPNHVFTLLYHPDGPGRTLESADMLVHPSALADPEAQAKIDAIAAFWGMVNLQDVAAVERVQQGLQARTYTGGRMCFRFEEPVHRFQNMVIDRMVGIDRVPPADGVDELESELMQPV